MIRTLVCTALAAGFLMIRPAPAEAAESHDSCVGFIDSLPATIATQGVWCLNSDRSTGMTSGNAITINTNNVTIDCNHFRLGGLAAGAGTTAYGIRATSRFNATVRNCNIRGFRIGVDLSGGGHLVENNSFDSNTWHGVSVSGAGSTIRNNRVIDTGGSTASTGTAFGISASSGVDVLDNTVNGVAPTGVNANAFGIRASSNSESSINGNRVRGLAANGTGLNHGIYNTNSGRIMVRDNDVQGSGSSGSIGIRCISSQGTARGNIIAGFETGVLN
jgi:parallel beta-helix repeat protein